MKLIATALVAAGLLASAPVMASADLAKAKNCMSCHAVDKKLVGPSYQEVAAKHKGNAGAVKQLAEKIMKGGVGVYGQVPMPPNPQVTQAEAEALAKWVLAGAK